MAHGQLLYPGCDVWLNNPLRPLEACGTSGMKAALNGCLNLSVRDGWWDEWFDGDNGWAIPTADGVDRPRPPRRAGGRRALRPDRERGRAAASTTATATACPSRWIEMVRHTLTTLGPKVLAGRMVRDYVDRPVRPGRPLGAGRCGRRVRRAASFAVVEAEGRPGVAGGPGRARGGLGRRGHPRAGGVPGAAGHRRPRRAGAR